MAMHRIVLGLGRSDPRRVDHVNRNKLDNRRCNLRFATHAENMQNRPSHAGSSSRFRGVCWEKAVSRWRAYGQLNEVFHHLGYFDDEGQAARAAAKWRANNLPFSMEAHG